MKLMKSLALRRPKNKKNPPMESSGHKNEYVAQIYVFKGEEYLGWDCFVHDRIIVGNSPHADMVLAGNAVAPNQAEITFDREKIYIKNLMETEKDVCNRKVLLSELDALDIGEFSLKIKRRKMKRANLENAITSKNDFQDETRFKEEKSVANTGFPYQAGNEKKNFQGAKDTKAPDKRDAAEHVQKNNGTDNPSEGAYCIVFSGEIVPGTDLKGVKSKLKRLLKADAIQVAYLLSGTPVVIKRNVDKKKADTLHQKMSKYGLVTEVVREEQLSGILAKKEHLQKQGNQKQDGEHITGTDEIDSGLRVADDQVAGVGAETDNPQPELNISPPTGTERLPGIEGRPTIQTVQDQEEDEEEEDNEASFTLLEKFQDVKNSENPTGDQAKHNNLVLEILKCRGNTVVDIRFLKPKEKYILKTEKGKFCLAENRSQTCQYVYFDQKFDGSLLTTGEEDKQISDLRVGENLINRRKGIYRIAMGLKKGISLEGDSYRFEIRSVYQRTSPVVEENPKSDGRMFKHLVKSSFFHLILLTFVGLFPTFTPPGPPPPETHFVKIDTYELAEIQKRIAPPPKKPKAMAPKPKPKPANVAVTKSKKKTRVARKKTPIAKRKAVASKHPKAGGGFGKGNIKNRNINQTGILSMLGDTVGLKPQEAMAAVTNLDAVSSTVKRKNGFKVGGIVGKLGDQKVSLPTSGIVNTKGSTQVLRSAGAKGDGRVAALAKGKTGQNKVMAMVSAQLNKSVRIQGGMSREAVKKVIDQHLDEISYCYETALVVNPSIMSKVIFEWKILLSGKVGAVKIKSSSINSNEIHSCIQAAIRTWQFPKPAGNEVVVSYPFIFDIVGF